MPDIGPAQWMLALVAAFCFGISKAGFPGTGTLGAIVMAAAIPGRASTGIVLPMLILGDLLAASAFRTHVQWALIRRIGWPVAVGIVAGWQVLRVIPDAAYRPIIGSMVLAMVALQFARQRWPRFDARLPHSRLFGWLVGLLTGTATMVANAAGPIAAAYFIILSLPKQAFVHTIAWLFLLVNLAKVPFGVQLGLINVGSLTLNAWLVPAVLAGLWSGKRLVDRISQRAFEQAILAIASASAAWLLVH